jgi:hypothetical protein
MIFCAQQKLSHYPNQSSTPFDLSLVDGLTPQMSKDTIKDLIIHAKLV